MFTEDVIDDIQGMDGEKRHKSIKSKERGLLFMSVRGITDPVFRSSDPSCRTNGKPAMDAW